MVRIADVRSGLREIAEEEGFLRCATPSHIVWARRERSVWPYYKPDARKYGDLFKLSGAVGLWVPEFEDWWSERVHHARGRTPTSEGLLFAWHLFNEPIFINAPVFEVVTEVGVRELVRTALNLASDLALSPSEIGGRLSAADPDDPFFRKMGAGSTVKLNGFIRWSGGTRMLPVPEDDPDYDLFGLILAH